MVCPMARLAKKKPLISRTESCVGICGTLLGEDCKVNGFGNLFGMCASWKPDAIDEIRKYGGVR